jgi:hypothetical protein
MADTSDLSATLGGVFVTTSPTWRLRGAATWPFTKIPSHSGGSSQIYLAARYSSGTSTCRFRLSRHIYLVAAIYSWVSQSCA